jgi:hypothetical protein
MKTAHIVTVAALFTGVAMSSPAHAQFANAFKKLTGSQENAAPATAAVPDEAVQEALVQQFARTQSHSMAAQIAFAQAFGLAEQVQLLEAERMSLSGGAVNTDTLKKSVSVSESVQEAIAERLAAQPELSSDANQHYSQGLAHLALSVVETRKLVTEAARFTSGLSGINPLELASISRKLAAGAWVAKETPGYAPAPLLHQRPDMVIDPMVGRTRWRCRVMRIRCFDGLE